MKMFGIDKKTIKIKKKKMKLFKPIHIFCIIFLSITGCDSFKKDIGGENLEGSFINNKEKEIYFSLDVPKVNETPIYPWNKKNIDGVWRITKDFFRCKGDLNHPLISKDKIFIKDCSGAEAHGLPVRDGKEFIYPCLIDLLNYVQEKTKKKVVITTGHRCPAHNNYADPSSLNKSSKHLLGAEVDFYVEGMEKESEKIIALLQNYYKTDPTFCRDKEYFEFQKMDASKYHVSIAPWANKEILIKLNLENENRDFDNSHDHAYITIQVRFDRETNKKVVFDEKQIGQYLKRS